MAKKGYTDIKTIFSISMSPALQARLDEEAAKHYRSRSAMIEEILRKYFLGGPEDGTKEDTSADFAGVRNTGAGDEARPE